MHRADEGGRWWPDAVQRHRRLAPKPRPRRSAPTADRSFAARSTRGSPWRAASRTSRPAKPSASGAKTTSGRW